MMKGKNVPKIRFKGFAEEWEEKKLGDLAEEFYGGGTPKTTICEYWDGDIPWIQTSDLTEDKIYGLVPQKYISKIGIKESATKLVPGNSIAIITRVGVGKLSLIPFKYSTSQDFLSMSKLKINEMFATYAIHKKMQITLNEVQGTSIKGITKEELLSKEITVPANIQEQTCIGNYFQKIDSLINKTQSKLDKLKNIKKACLEKMFPKKGSTIPEIRFKGYTEEWEEKVLGDLADVIGGGTPKTTICEYWDGDIPWIQTSDLTEDKIYGLVPQKYISKIGIKESATKLVPGNSIAIITRVGVGKLSLIPFKYSTSQDFLSMSKLKINEMFATYAIHKKMQITLNEVQGTSIKGITKEELLSKEITVPANIQEQTCIGNYFQKIDSLINKTQSKLDKLKNIKKACLEKMFVNKEDTL